MATVPRPPGAQLWWDQDPAPQHTAVLPAVDSILCAAVWPERCRPDSSVPAACLCKHNLRLSSQGARASIAQKVPMLYTNRLIEHMAIVKERTAVCPHEQRSIAILFIIMHARLARPCPGLPITVQQAMSINVYTYNFAPSACNKALCTGTAISTAPRLLPGAKLPDGAACQLNSGMQLSCNLDTSGLRGCSPVICATISQQNPS